MKKVQHAIHPARKFKLINSSEVLEYVRFMNLYLRSQFREPDRCLATSNNTIRIGMQNSVEMMVNEGDLLVFVINRGCNVLLMVKTNLISKLRMKTSRGSRNLLMKTRNRNSMSQTRNCGERFYIRH